MISAPTKWTAIVLIVAAGLLNLHIPHFFLEPRRNVGTGEYLLELALLANTVVSLIAAIGIYRSMRLGWVIGIGVCALSAALWLAQETIGLPGLPRQWLEPSRVVALAIEAAFAVTAWRRMHATRRARIDIRAR